MDVVLHKHPLHVEKPSSAVATSRNTPTTSNDIHSFASIVKTQQQASLKQSKPQSPPAHVEKSRAISKLVEADEVDESLKAYANELARDADSSFKDERKPRYASVNGPP